MDQISAELGHRVLPQASSFHIEGIAIYAVNSRTGALEIEYLSQTCLQILHLAQTPRLPCRIGKLGLAKDAGWQYEQKLRHCLTDHNPVQEVQTLHSPEQPAQTFFREVYVTAALAPARQQHFLIELSRSTTEDGDTLSDLSRQSASFLALLEQSVQRVWELDLKTNTFTIFDPLNSHEKPVPDTLAFPNDFLSQGLVHPRSLPAFRTFVRKILGGDRQGGATLIMRTSRDSGYSWHNLSYRTLFDAEGLPKKAVGVLHPVESAQLQPRYFELDRLWEQLLTSLHSFACINLNTEQIEKLWISGHNPNTIVSGRSYGALIDRICIALYTDNSKQRVRKFLDVGNLRKLARKRSPYWVCDCFELVENQSYVQPVAIHVLLDTNAQTETRAFIFMQHSVDTHRRTTSARLPGSCVFPQPDARGMIIVHLHNAQGNNAHALVRVCDYRKSFSETQFNDIVAAFSLFCESFAIVSIPSDRTVSIFMPEIDSAFKAREKLETAFTFVKKTLAGTELVNVRFVAALTFGLLKPEHHDEFLHTASLVCSRLENEPVDTIECMSPIDEIKTLQSESVLFASQPEDKAFHHIISNSLSNKEKTLLITCLDVLIRSDKPQTGLMHLLSLLGIYYKADRVYTLRAIQSMHVFEETGEWDNSGKSPFKKLIHGMQISKFPLLERVLKTSEPVFISRRKRSLSLQLADGALDDTWSFFALPFGTDQGNGALPVKNLLLCIDNPREEIPNWSLPQALTPYLTLLHDKLLKAQSELLTAEDFKPHTIKTYSEYKNKLIELTSEHYYSMGALVAAVPQLLLLDKKHGTEHCYNLLMFLQDLIGRSFGNAVIFKKYSEEFVVLAPNTTQEIFFERVEWLQKTCERQYPQQIEVGATWSRDIFNAADLINEARTFMLIQSVSGSHSVDLGSTPATLSLPMLQSFDIYLQPKVDMINSRIVGAEALIRGIDKDGRIVGPGSFLSAMESKGALRSLDLFVLSQALLQLDRWQKNGHPLVPISVNFSRYTLFDRATSGAVLAILSNYEHIDPSYIEIEITETACTVEEATLARTLAPYRDMGLHFALDDFGAGYANLSIFSKLAFETIKLDRSIVHDIGSNPVSRSLIESILRISHEHNITVVAEGVETEEQASVLKQKDCRIAQGNFFDKPMDVDSFTTKYLSASTQPDDSRDRAF